MTDFMLVLLTTFLILVTVTVGQQCTTVTTFNTALLPRTEGYDVRRAAVPTAVRDENADVVCLQEVWFEQDVNRIVETAGDVYPYHYSVLHDSVGDGPDARRNWFTETPCNAQDAWHFYTGIFWCALNNGCVAAFQQDFELGLQCAVSNCRADFQNPRIRRDCLTCVILTAVSLTGLVSGCTSEFRGNDNRLNSPGLVLLSKRPLANVAYTSYFPDNNMMLPRGYISAEVDGLGNLMCTHLTSLFRTYFEYDLDFPTYLEQQAAEVEILPTVFTSAEHYIVGDINSGPARPDETGDRQLQGEAPANFQRILDLGYSSPYMDQVGRCSFCKSNPITDGAVNVAIDHTLIPSGSSNTYTAERVLDGTYNNLPLSDHYGVRTRVCPPPTR